MEIFELLGKIAVEGTDDAIKAIDKTINFAIQGENKISGSLDKIMVSTNDFWGSNNLFDVKNLSLSADKIGKTFSEFLDKSNFNHDINAELSFNNSDLIDVQKSVIAVLGNISDGIQKTSDKYDIQTQSLVNSKNAVDDYAGHAEKLKNIKINLNLENKLNIDDEVEKVSNKLPDSNSIVEKIIMMKNAVSEGMPDVLKIQMDSLEKIYSGSVKKWHKIGNTASVGITDMANNIKNGKSFIDSACLLIANSAVENLTINASSAGQYIMDTFDSGLYSKASQIYSTASSIASNISQTLSSVSINVSGSVSSTKSKLAAHAKGGIVTREHIARVGEDGAEAIIPLEKNTEWIDKVASRINGNVGSNSEILEKLTELNENIKNLKVYLDSGTLVGEIAPKMDKKLGSIAKRKRRGAVQ